MRSRKLERRGTLIASLLLLGAGPVALADVLHLVGGGTIEVDRWRVDGEWIYYEQPEGSVGIPRNLVLRVDSSSSGGAQADRRVPLAVLPDPPTTPADQPALDPQVVEKLRQAKSALEARDFETASGLYLELMNGSSELYVARLGHALSELALGRDKVALSVVLDGLARDPGRAELHELIGDLRNREERVEDALRSWREAFDLSPTDRVREKITKAQRELIVGRDYEYATTSHFTLRYDGDVDLGLAGEILKYLEQRYWEVSQDLRHAPPQPITLLLYPTRQFRDVTQSPEWVGGVYDGKIRVPLGGLRRLDPGARAVLSHELAHAVIHSKTRGQCPRWLHEGLAQIVEGRRLRSSERVGLVRRLANGDPADWESVGFSYPAALSLTRYLESLRGFNSLVWLLNDLAEGQDLDHALDRIYGFDYADICRRWARELVGG